MPLPSRSTLRGTGSFAALTELPSSRLGTDYVHSPGWRFVHHSLLLPLSTLLLRSLCATLLSYYYFYYYYYYYDDYYYYYYHYYYCGCDGYYYYYYY